MNHEKVVVELELDDVLPNRFQPRFKFNEQAINELAESIKEHGVIQPILVRRLGDKYEIIAGERRYKASLLAGKRTIPAIIAELNDKDSAEVALIENVQRQDLTPIEEAVSYRKILDMGYLTQEQLAEKLGKTQSTISNKLRLLNLDDAVQEALLDEKISERHARSLLRIESKQQQVKILDRIITERLTVKKTDELIKNILSGSEEIQTEQEIEIPSIFMNNSVQIEEPAIQSSSAIEFINNDSQIVNSFGNNENKDNEIIDFLNIENNQEMSKVAPEEIREVPIIENLDTLDNDEELIQNIPQSFGQYDIPTSPIVEEIEEEQMSSQNIVNNSQDINELIGNISNEINPGFVDVDNIEQNAKDIYVEKPLADIDNLLMTSNGTENSSITSFDQMNIESENTEEPASQNKFFTMLAPEEDEEQTETPTIESNSDETFNFNPIIENSNNINQFLNENNQNEQLIQSNNIPTDNQPFSFATEEVNIENNVSENIVFNEEAPEPIEFSEKIEEIEDSPKIINYPADNILAESIRKDDVMENKPIEINNESVVDLKTIINTIRNCADTIEKYGFALECEEYDFEDMYQVIFKIQKNDK